MIENELTQAKSHLDHYEKKRKEHMKVIEGLQKEHDKNKSVVDVNDDFIFFLIR